MRKEAMFEVLGDLDESYIKDAHNTAPVKVKKPVWVKWGSLAACLCLVMACAVTLLPSKKYDTMTGDPVQSVITGDPIKPEKNDSDVNNTLPGAAHTENAITDNQAGEGSYVTAAHMIEIQVKIDTINSWGFIGTIETGAVADTCTFREGEQISVVCEDNVSIVQKDGSIFDFDEVEPNVDKSDLEVGASVWIGFQSYDYAEGYGMYNQIFAYHVSTNID